MSLLRLAADALGSILGDTGRHLGDLGAAAQHEMHFRIQQRLILGFGVLDLVSGDQCAD